MSLYSWTHPVTQEVTDYRLRHLSTNQWACYCGDTFFGYIRPHLLEWGGVPSYLAIPESTLECIPVVGEGFKTVGHAAECLGKVYTEAHFPTDDGDCDADYDDEGHPWRDDSYYYEEE